MNLFEWCASAEYSLKALTKMATAAGLTNCTGGSPLVKAKIHQLLHNPIYCGNLTPAYIKPFDVFARGSVSGEWLLGLDSVPLAASVARRGATGGPPERHE